LLNRAERQLQSHRTAPTGQTGLLRL
jgi:hypothetical protein